MIGEIDIEEGIIYFPAEAEPPAMHDIWLAYDRHAFEITDRP